MLMKRMNWKAWVVTALGPVMLLSCSTAAHIEKDESVNFNNYKSFAWLHGDEGKLENQSDLVESKVRQAVTAELQKTGWRQDYDLLVERASKETNEAVYSQPYNRLIYNPYTRRYATIYYPSQFLGYESYEQLIKEGTITITMIDAKTDKVVWQGWTTGEVNNRNITSKEIQNAVRSIFKKFDVAKN
jgi:Domain of unknown function (DUF4136)